MRISSPVLRAAGGEVPLADSPEGNFQSGVGDAFDGVWQIDMKIGSNGSGNFCETFYLNLPSAGGSSCNASSKYQSFQNGYLKLLYFILQYRMY